MNCIFCKKSLLKHQPDMNIKFYCTYCPNKVIFFLSQPGFILKTIQFNIEKYYVELNYQDQNCYIFDTTTKLIRPITTLNYIENLTPTSIGPWLNRILKLKAFL